MIQKRNSQSQLRLLAAITEINDGIVKPVSILPNILRVIESVAAEGVSIVTIYMTFSL
jgi:hypothetical protein